MNLNWKDILSELGIFTIIAGLITWLIKQLGQSLIDRNLKTYESELNHKLEQYKSALNLEFQKATKLHDQRLERINELYGLLTDFYIDLDNLTRWKIVTGKSDEQIEKEKFEDAKKTYESGQKFSVFYEKNKLIFNKQTCEQIEEILKILKSSQFDLTINYHFMNLSLDLQMEKFNEARENIQNKVPQLKTQLEDNFRSILGVD